MADRGRFRSIIRRRGISNGSTALGSPTGIRRDVKLQQPRLYSPPPPSVSVRSSGEPDYSDFGDENNVDYTETNQDYSDFSDQSQSQDYSEPSSRRAYDDTESPAYHHGPRQGEGYQTYFDRQNDARNNLLSAEKKEAGASRSGASGYENPWDSSAQRGSGKDRGRDIARSERSNTDTPGFQYNNTASKEKTKKKGGSFFGRHKKGIAGLSIGLTGGLVSFLITTLISGPAHFLQLANLLQDTFQSTSINQLASRSIHNYFSSVAHKMNNTALYNTTFGKLQEKLRTVATDKVKSAGMEIFTDPQGGITSIVVDPAKSSLGSMSLGDIGAKLDIDVGRITAGASGKISIDMSNMKYFDSKSSGAGLKTVVSSIAEQSLEASGKSVGEVSKFSKFILERKLMKEMDIYNPVFHPIRYAKDKVNQWWRDLKNKRVGKDSSELDDTAKDNAKNPKDDSSTSGSLPPIDFDANSQAKDIVEALSGMAGDETKEIISNITEQAIGQVAPDANKLQRWAIDGALEKVLDPASKFNASSKMVKAMGKVGKLNKAASIVGKILSVYCYIHQINELRQNAIIQAVYQLIIMAKQFSGIVAQMQAGDIEMDTLGELSKFLLYTPGIKEMDLYDDGDGDTYAVSSGRTTDISAEDGEGFQRIFYNRDVDDMTRSLTRDEGISLIAGENWANKLFGGLDWLMNMTRSDIVCDGISGTVIRIIVDTVATATEVAALVGSLGTSTPAQIAAQIAARLTVKTVVKFAAKIILSVGTSMLVGFAINKGMEWLNGGGIGTFFENNAGGNFTSVVWGEKLAGAFSGMFRGGHTLSDAQAYELNKIKAEQLAYEWDKKPLLVKLFDPTEYRSMIATIARDAHFNTSEVSFATVFGNTFKLFATVPTWFFGGVFSGASSYASGLDPLSDYFGFNDIAFDHSEMTRITEDSTYSVSSNTEKVFSLLDSDLSGYNKYTEQCMGKTIEKIGADYIVSDTDPDNLPQPYLATSAYHGVGPGNIDCSKRTDSQLRVALFVGVDYDTMQAMVCYEYDSDNNKGECGIDGVGFNISKLDNYDD